MPELAFPTRPRPNVNQFGFPARARGCRCHHPFTDEDDSCMCGRWLPRVIEETWRRRAREIAKVNA